MATPIVQFQSATNRTQRSGGAVHFEWQVNDEAGDPIDISSGWVANMYAFPQQDYNPAHGGLNLGASGTFTYGADGLLEWDAAFAVSGLPTITKSSQLLVKVSNDAFTTAQVLAQDRLQIVTP